MKCRESNNKCECKTCSYMKDCYCEYFKSSHMCDKCDWKGYVVKCPIKIRKTSMKVIILEMYRLQKAFKKKIKDILSK